MFDGKRKKKKDYYNIFSNDFDHILMNHSKNNELEYILNLFKILMLIIMNWLIVYH